MEIIARGDHLVVMVNGRVTVDFVDTKERYTRGPLALQVCREAPTPVRVRKIEIRELPATPALHPFVRVGRDGRKNEAFLTLAGWGAEGHSGATGEVAS